MELTLLKADYSIFLHVFSYWFIFQFNLKGYMSNQRRKMFQNNLLWFYFLTSQKEQFFRGTCAHLGPNVYRQKPAIYIYCTWPDFSDVASKFSHSVSILWELWLFKLLRPTEVHDSTI